MLIAAVGELILHSKGILLSQTDGDSSVLLPGLMAITSATSLHATAIRHLQMS